MEPPPRIPFLGLDFDPLDVETAARAIVEQGRKLDPFVYVATPNVDHMVRLEKHPTLLRLYENAWLTLCDSKVLEALAKIDKLPLPAAPGADVVETLIRNHIDPAEPIAIIGGTAETIRTLRARYALTDIRWHDAPQGLRGDPDARAACIRFLKNNPAPFTFLAVGSPQQEMIGREALQMGGCVGVGVCCGASLDFLSGEQKRAPEWMRGMRMEWLHRLGSDPGRLGKRYLVEGPGIIGVWLRWKKAQKGAETE